MKSILLFLSLAIGLNSCSVFHRTPKYGCPVSGAAVGAERVGEPDRKLQKAMRKSKYKGGNKFKY